jgi:hypothetical protein
MHFFKNIFLKAIIVYLSFISLVFAHELRPNIANLDITKNEKTTNAKLNLKINLEAIIVELILIIQIPKSLINLTYMMSIEN